MISIITFIQSSSFRGTQGLCFRRKRACAGFGRAGRRNSVEDVLNALDIRCRTQWPNSPLWGLPQESGVAGNTI